MARPTELGDVNQYPYDLYIHSRGDPTDPPSPWVECKPKTVSSHDFDMFDGEIIHYHDEDICIMYATTNQCWFIYFNRDARNRLEHAKQKALELWTLEQY